MIERGSTRAFLDAEALGQRAGGDVAHHHFERDDLDFLDQLLAHVEAADEVGRNADAVQMGEDVLGNAVVEHALAVDDLVLLLVEGGGVVLEELDQRARLGSLIEDLGLAFINAAAIFHLNFSLDLRAGGKRPVPVRLPKLVRRRLGFNAGSIPITPFAQSANPFNQPLSGLKCRSAACDEAY